MTKLNDACPSMYLVQIEMQLHFGGNNKFKIYIIFYKKCKSKFLTSLWPELKYIFFVELKIKNDEQCILLVWE